MRVKEGSAPPSQLPPAPSGALIERAHWLGGPEAERQAEKPDLIVFTPCLPCLAVICVLRFGFIDARAAHSNRQHHTNAFTTPLPVLPTRLSRAHCSLPYASAPRLRCRACFPSRGLPPRYTLITPLSSLLSLPQACSPPRPLLSVPLRFAHVLDTLTSFDTRILYFPRH
ncbi:hypothetical protein BU16DRAFT_231358 [Lophium mytilinum]|uniref:Uncharacterized protein n=1 Tax=Lophium mytilinum TaxID=390894 RepID=A0A6A6Q8L2_9PEZI|nr:hypothetical protein BU16DRAFT_231358 [Lophium mytilinum]